MHHIKRITYCLIIFSIGLLSAQTIGLLQFAPETQDGYVLFAPSASSTALLIDNCGRLVHSWETNSGPGLSSYLLENGNYLTTGRIPGNPFNGGGIGGIIELYSWENDLLWSYQYANDLVHQHHDIAYLPNGNILVLAWEYKTPQEAYSFGRQANTVSNNGFWPVQVVELEMIGESEANIVWEWHSWDHMIQDQNPSLSNYGVVQMHPEKFNVNFNLLSNNPGPGGNNGISDWFHCNSIDYNQELDLLLLSSRNWNEIYIIDHSTTSLEASDSIGGNYGKGGDILYRWGNPKAYDRGNSDAQKLFGQHDCKFIPSGHTYAGGISIFNNGFERPQGEFSSVDIMIPPTDANGNFIIAPDEPFGPELLSWTYLSPIDFYAQRISGVQSLENGNIMICEGTEGRFFEVNPDGEIVWEYINPIGLNGPVAQGSYPNGNDVFRCTRYESSYGAFDDVILIPGEPVELNPTDYVCPLDSLTSVIQEFGIDSTINFSLQTQKLIVTSESIEENAIVQIFDIQGKLMEQRHFINGALQFDLRTHLPGVYFMQYQTQNHKQTFKYILHQ